MHDLRHRFRPTLGGFLGAFVAAAVTIVGARRLFGDSDPATHVATGYWIFEHGEAPSTDPFSGTFAGSEWFAYEWLADLIFAGAHAAAGWPGLVALSALLIAGAHLWLYRFLVRAGSDPLVGFLVVLAAAGAASSHWLARPHLFTVLGLVLWVTVIEDVLSGRSRTSLLAVLPVSIVVWANLHGGFLVVFPLIAAHAAGELVASRFGPSRPGGPRRPLVALLTVGVASLAASLVNPGGFGLLEHIVRFSLVPARLDDFAPARVDRAGLALGAFLVVAVVGLAGAVAARHGRERRRGDPWSSFRPGAVLALAFATVMALRSIRHVEIVAVLGSVVAAGGITAWVDARRAGPALREARTFRERERAGGGIFAVVAVVLGALAMAGWPSNSGYDPRAFPVEMVRRLRAAGVEPRGPVFSPDLWGGYLILEWPEARVFVDGRWDMYGAAFGERYARLWRADEGWADDLDDAGVTWSLLPPDSPLAGAMDADPRWQVWSVDTAAVAFTRPEP